MSQEESNKVYEMASNSSRRKQFVNYVVNFCKDYDFDGIDLIWQIPSPIDGSPNPFDKSIFTALLKDLNKSFRFVHYPHLKISIESISIRNTDADFVRNN